MRGSNGVSLPIAASTDMAPETTAAAINPGSEYSADVLRGARSLIGYHDAAPGDASLRALNGARRHARGRADPRLRMLLHIHCVG